MKASSTACSIEHEWLKSPCRVRIVDAAGGVLRRYWLEERLTEAQAFGPVQSFYVSSDFVNGGPWAGVSHLFSALLPEIQSKRPDLIEKHASELVNILPILRRSIEVRNRSLTDLSTEAERTRNYPADRATRDVHGLIDLLDSWKGTSDPDTLWIIACDDYDRAGEMGRLFFRELMRRRGERLNLRLLVAVEAGGGEAVRDYFGSHFDAAVSRIPLPASRAIGSDDAREAIRVALELEKEIGGDQVLVLANLSELLKLWEIAGNEDKVLQYKSIGLGTYNALGLYADALRYGDGLLDLVADCRPNDIDLRWLTVRTLLMCHLGLNDIETGFKLATEGLTLSENRPEWRDQIFYIMAMLYARFRKPQDFAKGEEYLERSLVAIEEAALSESERHFRFVFNRNGLAMIRNFQKRPDEAIEICRSGYERLDATLEPGEHRLHRSILLYNIAQVYAATGHHSDAVKYLSEAIAMDPNYSEYYNDRANSLLQLERLEEAKQDYLTAIELSPPYFEVFINLGQCYRRMGANRQAVDWYSRALDIQPGHLLAILGRAKAYEEEGESVKALADYTAALSADPTIWEAAASRAILHYDRGDVTAALADLDQAIALQPGNGDLYQNRATVLTDLGRLHEAADDLTVALRCNPSQEDELIVREKLQELSVSAPQ